MSDPVQRMALVPVEASPELQHATLYAGYLHVGATPDEAKTLTDRVMSSEEQLPAGDAQWKAAIAAAPNAGKVTKQQSNRVLGIFEELVAQQVDADSAMATAIDVALGLEVI